MKSCPSPQTMCSIILPFRVQFFCTHTLYASVSRRNGSQGICPKIRRMIRIKLKMHWGINFFPKFIYAIPFLIVHLSCQRIKSRRFNMIDVSPITGLFKKCAIHRMKKDQASVPETRNQWGDWSAVRWTGFISIFCRDVFEVDCLSRREKCVGLLLFWAPITLVRL